MSEKYAPWFTDAELACKCGCGRGAPDMDELFMRNAIELRKQARFPWPVTSGFRCPDYNERVSSSGRDGPHTFGKALNIGVYGWRAVWMRENCTEDAGITGFGARQKGTHEKRFIHIDGLSTDEYKGPRPWFWTY